MSVYQLTTYPASALPSVESLLIDSFAVQFTGWLFREARSDEGLVVKRLLQRLIDKHLSWTTSERELFEERSALFLRVGISKKIAQVFCGTELIWSGFSGSDGFIQGDLILNQEQATLVRTGAEKLTLTCANQNEDLNATIPVSFPAGNRFVVVSDIDDTLKLSAVWNTREMLARTFAQPFEPIPEIAESFRHWAALGAEFHYVSTSPWQLYVPLREFMINHGFPDGVLHLRRLNWRRPNPFKRRSRVKVKTLVRLLEAYSDRSFVLVGDDVERDPELYSKVALRFPGTVDKVFIRRVRSASDGSLKDFHRARSSAAIRFWKSFDNGSELDGYLS